MGSDVRHGVWGERDQRFGDAAVHVALDDSERHLIAY